MLDMRIIVTAKYAQWYHEIGHDNNTPDDALWAIDPTGKIHIKRYSEVDPYSFSHGRVFPEAGSPGWFSGRYSSALNFVSVKPGLDKNNSAVNAPQNVLTTLKQSFPGAQVKQF